MRQNTTEPQAESVGRNEVNDLVVSERQYAEELRDNLGQNKRVETVQQPVVSKPAEIVKTNTVDEPGVIEQLIQLVDKTNTTPVPTGIRPTLTLESASTEIEQGVREGFVIDSADINSDLEDFGLGGIALEQPEELLLIDDTRIETGIFEDDSSIDVLLADLEEGMQQIEAEYMGELLVGMFVDFVKNDIIDEQEHALEQPLQATAIESTESTSDNSEVTTLQGFEEQFSLYLESLEPTQVEATKNVIEALSIAIRESQQLPEGTPSEEKDIIEQKLNELCIQLFESLGIEYDEETIKQFIQSITALELFVNFNIEIEELSIEALNNMGTREYKALEGTSLLGGLTQFIRQKMQPHLRLGKYALQAVA